MRHIMVLNAKGGCGKSTLATNIASYFANEGASVALADYDPQRSSLDWLDRRPENRAPITGVAGYDGGLRRVPRTADFVIIDAPARSHGSELTDLVKHAETIIVPVLPSTIDMQATTKFLEELKSIGKIERKQAKIGTVANRVRDNTLIFDELDEYLLKARTPYIAAKLRAGVHAWPRHFRVARVPGMAGLGRLGAADGLVAQRSKSAVAERHRAQGALLQDHSRIAPPCGSAPCARSEAAAVRRCP